MSFKVGDKVLNVSGFHSDRGKIYTVYKIDKAGIVWAGIKRDSFWGGYHQTGAGYLGKPTDGPMIRKLTKLDLALL